MRLQVGTEFICPYKTDRLQSAGQPVKLNDGTTVVADEAYVRESVLYPSAKIVQGYKPIMPTFKGQVTEEQLLQLIAYIKSLSPQEGKASK